MQLLRNLMSEFPPREKADYTEIVWTREKTILQSLTYLRLRMGQALHSSLLRGSGLSI